MRSKILYGLIAGITALLAMWLPDIAVAQLVDVQIVDDYGGAFRQYNVLPRTWDSNTHRAYIEAVKGERYGIRVRNNSGKRVGLVIAVDGRNILSGQKSNLQSNERMYILNPYDSGSYEGWRTGKNVVNKFYFTDAGDSYAGAWGDFTAMGVIAVAVFFEKYEEEDYSLEDERRFRYPYSGKKEQGKEKSLKGTQSQRSQPGTGIGEERYSPTRKVEFDAEPRPVEKYFFKYEWRKTLCRKGIIDCRHRPENRFWDNDEYVPFPPSRR